MILLPIFLPLFAAFFARFVKKGKFALPIATAACGVNFALNLLLPVLARRGTVLSLALGSVAGQGLSFGDDYFQLLYGAIAGFLWLMTALFSRQYLVDSHRRDRYFFFNLITLAGVMGVFYSGDLFTCFCFFEMMSFASYPLVVHEETADAKKAGETYLGVAVISGMLLLVGIFFLRRQTGTLGYSALRSFFATEELEPLTVAGGILVLLGFGAKAGMYPLHIWLPQAHPVAPAPASALLSGILTKTGVFGIIVLCGDVFFGNARFGYLLLALAVVTMFLGALLALFSVNLKRTLACSSMSQIGFILVGVSFVLLLGKEGGLAQAGALLHMTNHSLIKLVLFLCAGVVAQNCRALELNAVRGFGRNKPFFLAVFLVGALGIMGVPLFNGYVSKTMIHESIVEYIEFNALCGSAAFAFRAVEWIFLASGGLTVAYMTKLFVCLFVEKNENPARQAAYDAMTYLTPLSRVTLAVAAVPLVLIGVCPGFVTSRLITPAASFFGVEPLRHLPAFFGWESLKGAGISLLVGAAVYCGIVRPLLKKSGGYANRWNPKLDLERMFYRPLVVDGTRFVIRTVGAFLAAAPEWLLARGVIIVIKTVGSFVSRLFDYGVLLLCKTVFKPYVYRFREETFAYRFGRFIEKLNPKKKGMGEKLESYYAEYAQDVRFGYESFAFAFAMISLGIVVVLLFAIFA